MVAGKITRETVPAQTIEFLEPAEPRYDAPPDQGKWKPMAIGKAWGRKQGWTYFRAQVKVPSLWKSGSIDLRLKAGIHYLESPDDDNFPAGPEGQVFINGVRVGAIDRQHHSIRYPFKSGKSYDVRAVIFAGRCACRHALESLELAWIDPATEKLYHDLRVALDVVDLLDRMAISRQKLLNAVDAAIHALDVREIVNPVAATLIELRDPEGALFYASVPAAQKAFDEGLAQIQASGDVPEVSAVGHAHIDLAWLWPMKQTRHKCVRTFATQIRLLRQYPNWVFNQSSPQAYAWVEKDAPELFGEIRKMIAEGRWEADGAMWAESDTNLPCGESLVRQLLYGKKYFRERLCVDSRMLWLPDVFGYTAALPQILKLAGVEGFITSKISWNQYNRFPHDAFLWRGIDGSEIPTQFITTPCSEWFSTYNASLSASDVQGNWREFRQKALEVNSLMSFGYGDGGGGPTELMLETGQRLAAYPPMDSMPRVRYEKAATLLKRLADKKDQLPIWEGELYLEYHRGTYTTQAWLKQANRRNEIRLRQAEWLTSLAKALGYHPDKATLDSLWQDLLLMQFHDILPGSSVGEVYEEARPLQERIAQTAGQIIDKATDCLCRNIDSSGMQKPLLLLNTLSWDRQSPFQLPDGTWVDNVVVPAGGWKVLDAARLTPSEKSPRVKVSSQGRQLENPWWILRLNQNGEIIELFDRQQNRQVLAPGEVGNEWQIFEDRPLNHEAWDIDRYYQEHPLPKPRCQSIRIAEKGSVRCAVEVRWQVPLKGKGASSTIVQTIALYAHHPRIDFETKIDWHEHHQMLKVAFPVAIHATEATYQIQFGHIQRPTHRNTSWDMARFEGCAQQFVDLSEFGYGVALLNDSKYGHDIEDHVIRLTCLKSPQSPHALADQGQHQFIYSLLPHRGSFQEAGVIQAAAELNTPLLVREMKTIRGKLPSEWRWIECDQEAVIAETLKPAEDGKGQILRLYESFGSRVQATLRFNEPPRTVVAVDLLEQPMDGEVEMNYQEGILKLTMKPFQIVSLRLLS